MQNIFDSLKVVELASVLAGPSVGQFLAELGAEVIKIENPINGGDVTRSWILKGEKIESGVSAYFSAVNSGKKSLPLNLKEAADKQVLMDLLSEADILISSFKPGDAEKLGLSYSQLKESYPQLIYAEITGYGNNDSRVGYDAVLQAETGFMFMNGESEGPEVKMPVALIDILAAHQLKEAVLLAYINKLKNNKGAKVSVSLFDAAVSSLANQATNYLIAGKSPNKMGSEHPNIAPYGKLYTCSDQVKIILAVGNDHQFKRLCECLGLSNIASMPEYKHNQARVNNRLSLNELLQQAIASHDSHSLLKSFNEAQVPAGRLNSVKDVFDLKQAQKIILHDEKHKTVGLRNFIAETDFLSKISHLSPPPPLKEK